MNFLVYKQIRALKEMSSALLIRRFLLCEAKTCGGRGAVRCLSTDPEPRRRKRRHGRPLETFVPVESPEEEAQAAGLKTKLTDEQLDEMYAKKFYNSDVWKTVIERQTAKLRKPPRPRKDVREQCQEMPKKSEDLTVSYAAQAFLEESGWWKGELVEKTPEVPDLTVSLKEALSLPKAKTNYPFAMVKPANEVSQSRPALKELEEGIFDAEDLCKDGQLEERTKVDVMDGWQEAELETDSSVAGSTATLQELETMLEELKEGTLDPLLDPNYVERIEMKVPFQQEIYPSEIERVDRFKRMAMYGSPNPNIPSTNMPCGGCGAILHCQDSAIPGYLPSEMIENLTFLELQDTICQRCNFLQNYDVALNVSVSPTDYVRVISEIQDKNALVLLMVDLLDFPCSIWPGIIDIVGPSRPLVVVGNKVDMLPKDNKGYLERIKAGLEQSLKDFGIDTGDNIKHLALISAKTGYGIEELITSIQHHWGIKGDIYVIGCTNVGKSSLFNALLQSDLCKSQALDIIQRATVSTWPGTTLKLLKFPLLNPTPWRTHLRVKRLKAQSYQFIQERANRKLRLQQTKNPIYATLIGDIGMTFKTDDPDRQSIAAAADPFKMSLSIVDDLPKIRKKKFTEEDPAFAHGKWFYDTPGAVHYDQLINLLTLDELAHTIPKTMLNPRCIVIKPGQTFFLAGLGRIDYVEGSTSSSFMLYASNQLPVSVVSTKLADEFYQKYLGTEVLKVPFGDWERLKDFPPLKSKEVLFYGADRKECCGDIVLSSAGWVSVNFSQRSDVVGRFLAYTPEGRGCYFRKPALLQYSIQLRGKRIAMTPFCRPSKLVE